MVQGQGRHQSGRSLLNQGIFHKSCFALKVDVMTKAFPTQRLIRQRTHKITPIIHQFLSLDSKGIQ